MIKLFTVKEIASILQVKEKTLYQWAELGQIPSIKLNRCVRFDLKDIEVWVGESKKAPISGYNALTQARGPRKGGKR